LRSGSLSRDKLIGLLNAYFVPVYISYEAHDQGDAPAEDKKEWRRIYDEANARLKRSGTVHVYILAPADLEVIESIDIGSATQPDRLYARLEAVVRKLGTPRGKPVVAPSPQSTPPPSAGDSLVLHLAARSFKGTWNEFPVESWTVLGRAEAMSLLPAGDVKVGTSWELNKDVTGRFLTSFLPNGFNYARHHKVRIEEQSLRATVVSLDRGVAIAHIEGRLKLRHKTLNFNVSPPAPIDEFARMAIVGYIDFDRDKQLVRSLRLLADKATARGGEVEYAVGLRSISR
jgi:hypothetical protein